MAPTLFQTGICLSHLFAIAYSYPAEHTPEELVFSRDELRLAEFGELSEELVPRSQGSDDFYKFVTRPDIQAPRWDVTVLDKDAIAPGHWFFAPYSNLNQKDHDEAWVGPYIYAPDGELVWTGANMFQHWNIFDFKPAIVEGQRMASLLNTHERAGIILNSSYDRYTTQDLAPGEGHAGDMHAFHVLPNGTALTITLEKGPSSLLASKKIGFDGECKGSARGFMEIDLQTQEPIFSWSSKEHIGLEESMKIWGTYDEMCTDGWDSMHLNSIDKFPDGDYLLSSRHTNTLYKIDHHNGSIVWRLGGVKNDFKKDFIFSRQHHARVQSQNTTHTIITLFDNAIGTEANETATNDISRGLVMVLRTDKKPMTARVTTQYDHPRHLLTNSRGSMEMMPNGNAFICWTYGSLVTEHAPDGKIVMQARTKGGFNTYRMFKASWVGRPSTPPDVRSVAVGSDNGVRTSVWVSWNGDTEVKTWNLYRSTADGAETEFMVTAPRRGFETSIVENTYASYVVVEGLDANGASLGKSAVITTERASNMNSTLVAEDAEWLQQHTTQTPTPVEHSEVEQAFDAATASTTPKPNKSPDWAAAASSMPAWSSIPARPSATGPARPADANNSGNFTSAAWADNDATSLLTSQVACYIYGVLTMLLLAGLVWSVRRCSGGGSRTAWWKRGNGSGQKYDPVWDGQSMEMLPEDEVVGKE